jgi:hypothetical protein
LANLPAIRCLVPLVRPDTVIYAAYSNDIEPEYKPHLGGQTVLRLPFYPGNNGTGKTRPG